MFTPIDFNKKEVLSIKNLKIGKNSFLFLTYKSPKYFEVKLSNEIIFYNLLTLPPS